MAAQTPAVPRLLGREPSITPRMLLVVDPPKAASRTQQDHVNMIAGIPLMLDLGTRLLDPYVYTVLYHTILYHTIIYHIIFEIHMFMWSFGPQAWQSFGFRGLR